MAHRQPKSKPETMGRRLASVRALRGMSQLEAATKAGFTQPYLSDLENDKGVSPALNTIAKLADVYGVSIDYLVKGQTVATV